MKEQVEEDEARSIRCIGPKETSPATPPFRFFFLAGHVASSVSTTKTFLYGQPLRFGANNSGVAEFCHNEADTLQSDYEFALAGLRCNFEKKRKK